MKDNIQYLTKTSIASSVIFIALLAILHVIKNEINPSWQPISEYALGKNGWLMRVAFFAMAIATAAAMFVSFNTFKKIGGKIGTFLLVLSSIGFLLAGLFNTDAAIASNENMTNSGTVHSIGAGLAGMIVFVSLFLLWQVYKNPMFKNNRKALAYATILLWISEIILVISMVIYLPKNDGNLGPEVLVGWQNRFMVFCSSIWIITFSYQIKKVNK